MHFTEYKMHSKDYDGIDTKDISKLLSSHSITTNVLDIEKYYKSNNLKEQDIIDSIKKRYFFA